MTTIDTNRETFSWCCVGCGHQWQTVYEVRHTSDLCESERTEWFVDGHRVDSPWSGTRCPACTGLRTKVLPGR
jgi:hypothetical protein